MKAYGPLPQEQAMGVFVHDHKNAMQNTLYFIRAANTALGHNNLERVKDMLFNAERFAVKEQEAFDTYYKKFQADFADANAQPTS